MQVKSLDETAIYDIGHAFGYYDDGVEPGLISMFPNREAAAAYICGYVRMTLRGGFACHQRTGRGLYRLSTAGPENRPACWRAADEGAV